MQSVATLQPLVRRDVDKDLYNYITMHVATLASVPRPFPMRFNCAGRKTFEIKEDFKIPQLRIMGKAR